MMAEKTFEDAIRLEYNRCSQPFEEAYEIEGDGKRVKIILDPSCVRYVRFKRVDCRWKLIGKSEFNDGDREICKRNAVRWINRR